MASESARRDRDGKAPRSVEQITKAGQDYEYSASIGARYWLRTASGTVERGGTPRCCSFLRLTQSLQAKVYEYEDEDNDEQTYFLLFRHAHLILTQLAQHPNVKSPPAKEIFSKAQREVNRDLKKLNILKPRINKRYERYVRLVREREAKRAATRQDTTVAPGQKASHELNWDLNGDINFGDMKTEILPCGSLRRNSKDERSHAEKHADAGQSLAGDDLSWRFQQVRRRVDTFHQKPQSMLSDKPPDSTVPAQYNYPTACNCGRPPPVPAKPASIHQQSPPSLPDKVADKPTTVDKVQSKASYTFQPAAYLENGTPLRKLFLPPTLCTTFLRIAHKNTVANLETCAFLAGTLLANALFVSKFLVPAQTSTSDTSEMINDSQLFDYVDSQGDLIMLGWIHTHSRQSCFMSSRDLHTDSGNQMTLAESVAVVCAPSHGDTTHGGDWGVYRLTDPPGKMTILSCDKPGIFHPHEVANIYTDASRPGHVVEAPGLEFEAVD